MKFKTDLFTSGVMGSSVSAGRHRELLAKKKPLRSALN